MDSVVVSSLISGASGVAGALVKTVWDKHKANGHHDRAPHDRRSNGQYVESVIAQRAEVEFQTRMTLVMEKLTGAIEKGQNSIMDRMETMAGAMQEAAGAIQEVHRELMAYRQSLDAVAAAGVDSGRLIRELHQDRFGRQPTG